MESGDCAIYFNYAIVLFNRGYEDLAKELFERGDPMFVEMDPMDQEEELIA